MFHSLNSWIVFHKSWISGHGKLETSESYKLFRYHKVNSINVHNSNEKKCAWSKQIWIQIKTNVAHGV